MRNSTDMPLSAQMSDNVTIHQIKYQRTSLAIQSLPFNQSFEDKSLKSWLTCIKLQVKGEVVRSQGKSCATKAPHFTE